MKRLTAISKALSDRHRLMALAYLGRGELCVCQLTGALGLAQSTVSRHMAVLERAALVESRKVGRWVHYRRPGRGVDPAAADIIAWVDRHGGGISREENDRLRRARKAAGPRIKCCGRSGKADQA